MTIGCKKSNPGGTSGGMSGSFGGTAFQPSLVVGLDVGSILDVAGLQIVAGDSIGVLISFADNSAINTPLSFSDAGISYNDSKGTFDFESDIAPSHGTVTITSLDKTGLKVAGTYSGVIYDSSNDSVVTMNGQFNTTYKTF
jgi:hypothetical protein